MPAKSLPKLRPGALDLKDRRNLLSYLLGIATEVSAAILLMILAFAVSWLGLLLWGGK